MNKFEMDREEIDLNIRSLKDSVVSGKVSAEDAKKSFEELKLRKAEVEKLEALANVPMKRSVDNSFSTIREAALEKRAITVNGTGAINQVSEIVKLVTQKTPLLNAISYFYGPNSSTNIPLLSPGLAAPATSTEGYTSGSTDTTAVMSSVSITPVGYISTLPVSFEALNLSSANLEAQFPALFADIYARAMHKVIVDDLFASSGVASGNRIACGAAGLPTVGDLAKLAIQMQDYIDNAVIVIAPATYASAIAGATSESAKIYAEEMIRNKTIEGVKIILTGLAPVAVTADALVAVGGDLKNYGMGVAADLTITPKTKVGDSNVYFDSVMFFDGKIIQGSNLFALKAISGS